MTLTSKQVRSSSLDREWARLRRVYLIGVLRSSGDPTQSSLAIELLRTVVDAGEIRASDLAAQLFVTKTSISRYVNLMIREGLLTQRPDPSDGRASLLAVSTRGRAALREREARRQRALAELCEGWSPRDVATLTRLLGRLNDRWDERLKTLPRATEGRRRP